VPYKEQIDKQLGGEKTTSSFVKKGSLAAGASFALVQAKREGSTETEKSSA